MALDDQKLHDDIKKAFDTAATFTVPAEQASHLIDLLKAAIATYVRSAEVSGITVTVANTTGTQSGPVKLS